ncbi:MAG TPA: metallophosphoesterase [candidate division Zixibacteria bacterium]|nr:metallophosphoesterase [candidate division Zixibacteria bacterium]
MSLIFQVSDTHFGTEQPHVVEALVRLARERRPDAVVMSGDITQRARRRQFQAALAFVERLAAPATLVLPGNHDIPLFNLAARLFRPYGNYCRAFGSDLEPVLESPDFLVVGVNTTRPRRHKIGEVSAAQIARVAERLRAAKDEQLRIVVTHQPVHVIQPADEKSLLRGSERAVRAWADAGAELVMGGHIHLPYVTPLFERFSGLTRKVWIVQAGTAVSSRLRYHRANSVNLIGYRRDEKPRRCTVERWDYDLGSGRFEPGERAELELDDAAGE